MDAGLVLPAPVIFCPAFVDSQCTGRAICRNARHDA
jgi:hypothetical protein